MSAYGDGQVGFQVFSVTAAQLTDVRCVCLKAYFHYGGSALCCMALRGERNRNTIGVSISLTTQRTAVMEMSLNGMGNPTRTHWDSRCLPCWAPDSTGVRCGGGVGNGEEADTRSPGVHAHFTHVTLYTSIASIEASLDYYTNKNVVLRPAGTTDREGTRRLC